MSRGGVSLLLVALVSSCAQKPSAPSQAAPQAPVQSAAELYRRGKAALEAHDASRAIAAFSRAAALASDAELRANAWLALGAAYAEAGDHAHALAAYEQVTVLRPEDPEAWRVLAEGQAAAGHREAQARALEHVITLDPDDLGGYLDLAGLDAALGKLDKSKDVYVRYEARRRDALVALGKAKDPAARVAAAEVLGGARDAATARALVLALTDKNAKVRSTCAHSIGRIGVDVEPEVRKALDALLEHERDDGVRTAVQQALANAD